jgi:hypothetical protein
MIGRIRYPMLICFGYLFFSSIAIAETTIQVSYQHSVQDSAYDPFGQIIPVIEDYAAFDCPAAGRDTLFSAVSSELDLINITYVKRSRKGFGFFLSLTALKLKSYTLADISGLSPSDQTAVTAELAGLGCRIANTREITTLAETSLGLIKVFSLGSFELETALALSKPLSQLQPELAVRGSDYFLDISVSPSIGSQLRLSLPVFYRFSLPAESIDRTFGVKVSYQAAINLEVGLTKRLIGIKREVYDFMGDSISQSDSINGQASIYQDKSLFSVGFTKTLQGQNALVENALQVSIARFF